MRPWVFTLLGVLAVLLGGLWTLQGLGYVTGSFMTGSKLWLTIGLLLALAGIWSLVTGIRRSRG
ncbi:hypothetical protein GCM10010174_76250 [Kutzneria viridogrisea]|uniref:Type VI protein secretion system component VasK n=2 Tax=Kutzneria TaxID=43356 RepID=A0ABR6BNE0_9PSEU|nr:hypothetical protein [Kutzneria albida]AHH96374.1 putative secreted protein [Kutzneria albida DSM 43870]MBA8928411.1 type VI protein secretion system component VasK [Kutzneria viridogrisea]